MADDSVAQTMGLAAQVGPHVRRLDVLTTRVNFRRLAPPTQFPLNATLTASVEPSVHRHGLDVDCSVEAVVRDGLIDDEDPDGASRVVDASVGFLVQYETDPDVAVGFSKEQLNAFANHSVLFTVHPYLRHRLDALTGWAGLPRLILGTALQPLDDETERQSRGD